MVIQRDKAKTNQMGIKNYYLLCLLVFIVPFPSVEAGTFGTQQGLVYINSTSTATNLWPGDDVRFMCTTINSSIIAWSSSEYIGPGGIRLEFTPIDTSPLHGQSYTADLVDVSYTNDGAVVLISELNITLKGKPNFSITCHNVGMEVNDSVTWNISVDPKVSPEKQEVCPGDNVTITCSTGDSDSLGWRSDEYIGIDTQINVTFYETKAILISHIATSVATLSYTNLRNGVRLLVSRLNFTVLSSVENQTHTVMCVNTNLNTSSIGTLRMAGNCGDSAVDDENDTTNTTSKASYPGPSQPFNVVSSHGLHYNSMMIIIIVFTTVLLLFYSQVCVVLN